MFGDFFGDIFGGPSNRGYRQQGYPYGYYQRNPYYQDYDDDNYYQQLARQQRQRELQRQQEVMEQRKRMQEAYEQQRQANLEKQRRLQEQIQQHQQRYEYQQAQQDHIEQARQKQQENKKARSTKIKVGQNNQQTNQQEDVQSFAQLLADMRQHIDDINQNAQQRDQLIDNKYQEAAPSPNQAFKTYKSGDSNQNPREILQPLDQNSQSLLVVHQDAAIIEIPKQMVKDIQISANGAGILNIYLALNNEFVKHQNLQQNELILKYQLPPYYERADITAKQDDNCYRVIVPLSAARDDQMIINIE